MSRIIRQILENEPPSAPRMASMDERFLVPETDVIYHMMGYEDPAMDRLMTPQQVEAARMAKTVYLNGYHDYDDPRVLKEALDNGYAPAIPMTLLGDGVNWMDGSMDVIYSLNY